MEDQLVGFETAKLAKEKGFNIKTLFAYNLLGVTNNSFKIHRKKDFDEFSNIYCPSPTQSLLQKWLREKHHLIIIVAYQYEYDSTPYSYWIYKESQPLPINQWVDDLSTYEEALEIGLQEALKLI